MGYLIISKDIKQVEGQATFIKNLATMLENSVLKNINGMAEWDKKRFEKREYGITNFTQIQDDIKRLRRELMDLSKMVDWRY